jgi:beta-lactamase superfamily II metal-dependent hydrolase
MDKSKGGLEIKVFQAECGDAFRLRFKGNDNKFHNIFIDSGLPRTYRHSLDEEIQVIIQDNEKIDLWVISHIHDDHIGGVTKYLDTIIDGTRKDIVETWFYNPPRYYEVESQKINIISTSLSIGQGDKLFEYLKLNNKILEYDITNELPIIDLYGLKITILSPTKLGLHSLREKYKTGIELEKEEVEHISQAISSKGNDYNIPLSEFNISDFKEDDSIENQSSISLLIECNGEKTLWLADAFSSDVITSLNKLGYNETNQLQCQFVKVSHHGSKGNNSSKLYELISCSNYIISANGENKYDLPKKECLARIIRNPRRETNTKLKLYFNYDNSTLKTIFKIDQNEVFEKFNFKTIFIDKKKYCMKPKTLFLFLFFCNQIFAQSEIFKDTIYFDQDWKITNYLEDAKFARIAKRDPQRQIVGTVRDYYLPNWKIQFEGKVIGENPDIPVGVCTWYYENGQIQLKATYENGKASADIVQYNENGTKIECKDTVIEIFPIEQTKLHSKYNSGSSRKVYTIDVSKFKNITIQYRIEDEKGSSLIDFGTSLMALYSGGYTSSLMAYSKTPISQKGSTKNTFFITTNRDVAQNFINTKGTINNIGIIHFSENSINETKSFVIAPNVKYIYIGVQNNNSLTSAVSSLEVVGMEKVCK